MRVRQGVNALPGPGGTAPNVATSRHTYQHQPEGNTIMSVSVATISATITDVVTEELGDSIAQSYTGAIEALAEALTEREYNLFETLTDAGVEKTGYSRDDVEDLLEGAGLSKRPAPAPVEEEPVVVDAPATEDDRIARIEKQVKDLAETVNRLAGLAARHLGS